MRVVFFLARLRGYHDQVPIAHPKALGVTRPALSALLNERAALSSEMALRIEKAFGVSMDTLMRMQNSYDIAQARRRAGQIKVARFVRKVGDPSPAPA